ncbi:hypothetical protein [Methylibium sp.]|uniref:hypothetical protein n=1 Tax=Methylibium sp. TaxID=2067992 RepID=UPI0018160AF8|nr:hypothetical protein [Methylibium sp.]MBA3591872.1 hypothetical protein [Methylibium sp.]
MPEALASALVAGQRGKQREQVGQQIERHNALVSAAQAREHRDVPFEEVPRLCYRLPSGSGQQGELALLEREAVFDEVELNLLGQTIGLAGSTMTEQAMAWEGLFAPKELGKAQIGRLWAERSGGRSRFAIVFKPEACQNMTQQIDAALG